MTLVQAVTLGLVEGVTEFLPVSSTAHLFIVERLMGLATDAAEQSVSDSFSIAIQLGAILAVLGLYRDRIASILRGGMGKDEAGRRLAMCLLLAFFPAMLVAILFQQWIRRRLFGPWPIVVAWAAGGLAILLIGRRRPRSSFSAKSMEDLSWRAALGIGAAQCLALWPGVSRSLVTIAGGLAAGLGPRAAVEFSFLLGLLTLGTATVHELFINGGKIVALFGWWRPLAGLLVAAASAWVSMRWMVAYLQRHSFAVFGWYRIGVAALVTALLHGGFLS